MSFFNSVLPAHLTAFYYHFLCIQVHFRNVPFNSFGICAPYLRIKALSLDNSLSAWAKNPCDRLIFHFNEPHHVYFTKFFWGIPELQKDIPESFLRNKRSKSNPSASWRLVNTAILPSNFIGTEKKRKKKTVTNQSASMLIKTPYFLNVGVKKNKLLFLENV